MADSKKDKIIDEIIKIEEEMFKSVKTYEPAKCQEELKTFNIMRWMSHSVLSLETLESYLDDLKKAVDIGRNFMTEKYARMENLIPPLQDNPLIEKIVEFESKWMKEINENYPKTFTDAGPGFSNYSQCELETYSNETLKRYYNDVLNADKNGKSLVKERYNNLFVKLGYKSIDDREEQMKKNN